MSTIATHSKTKTLVPELRFSEFNGNWIHEALEGKIDVLSGTPIKSEDISEEKGGTPILRGINVTEGRIRHKEEIDKYYHREIDGLEKFLVQTGDLVLGMDGSKVGKNSAIISDRDSGSILIQRVARLRENGKSSLKFIYQHINSIRFHKYVDVVNTSSGIPHISLKQINEFKIHFPSLPEQQKIASFLSAVDEKIQQLSRKKALLEEYKKGVMQQIFTQQIRFKDEDGNPYPDWEEKRLGDVTKFFDGTHQTPKYVEEGVPFYSVEHVTANQFKRTKYISEEVFEKENKRVELENGDILLTRIGDIGTTKLIDWDVRASFYVSLALIKRNEEFDSKYLDQFINSVFFQRELWKRTIHVAFPKKINLGEIGNCVVKLPCLDEQIQIGNCLKNIDSNINKEQEKLNGLKKFKKGLLQKMFV